MLKFRLRESITPAPRGYVGLVATADGALATVDENGSVRPVVGNGSVTVSTSWGAITGKPHSYTPGSHSHELASINGLQAALDSISAGGVADGDKGDVTVSGAGTVWSVASFSGSAKGLVPSSAGVSLPV